MGLKIMFAAAIGLIAILLYVMSVFGRFTIHAKDDMEDRDRYLQRINLFYRIVWGCFFVCVFFILGLIFVILGQELLFWRWRSEGIVIYHPAAYTPHYISLIELSGLAIMSFALAMLIRLIRKEITDYMIF